MIPHVHWILNSCCPQNVQYFFWVDIYSITARLSVTLALTFYKSPSLRVLAMRTSISHSPQFEHIFVQVPSPLRFYLDLSQSNSAPALNSLLIQMVSRDWIEMGMILHVKRALKVFSGLKKKWLWRRMNTSFEGISSPSYNKKLWDFTRYGNLTYF